MLTISHLIKQNATLPTFDTVLLDQHENLVDLTTATAVTMRLQLVGDATTVGGGAVSVVDADAGSVKYTFTATDTQISGSYLATIKATFPGGSQVFPSSGYWLVVVEPDLTSDVNDVAVDLVFATVADARSMGYDLSVTDLLRGQGHIEVMCGRMIESIEEAILNEAISTQDVSRLKKATVYQSVWVRANPDVEERTDVTKIRTAGLSGESAELTADGITLAPLARRLLIGLSWVRSRSVRTDRGRGTNSMGMTSDRGPGWIDLR